MKKAMILLGLALALIASTQKLYAGRYYVPETARWTTPDPALREKLPNELVEIHNGVLLSTSPYAYTYNNPLKYTDPDGKIPVLVGAIGGAAFDLGLQVTTNYLQGKSLSDISWKQVAISAGLGAAGAGLASKAGQLFRLATKADDVVNLADDVIKVADDAANLADDASRGVQAIGENLKNVREIGSGRLKGFLRGNTDLAGGDKGARELFKQLTGTKAEGTFQRIVLKDGREVIFRAADKSKSGLPKIEIVDPKNKFLEKITFQEQ